MIKETFLIFPLFSTTFTSFLLHNFSLLPSKPFWSHSPAPSHHFSLLLLLLLLLLLPFAASSIQRKGKNEQIRRWHRPRNARRGAQEHYLGYDQAIELRNGSSQSHFSHFCPWAKIYAWKNHRFHGSSRADYSVLFFFYHLIFLSFYLFIFLSFHLFILLSFYLFIFYFSSCAMICDRPPFYLSTFRLMVFGEKGKRESGTLSQPASFSGRGREKKNHNTTFFFFFEYLLPIWLHDFSFLFLNDNPDWHSHIEKSWTHFHQMAVNQKK